MLNQSSWFIRISSAHVDLIRNLMIHFTSRQIVSDLVQSCHQITLSHFKTHRINCHFYESFHFMTIHSKCVVFLVVTAAHRNTSIRTLDEQKCPLDIQKYLYSSIRRTEMSIGHSNVHSSNGRTEMSIGHSNVHSSIGRTEMSIGHPNVHSSIGRMDTV